MRPRRYTIGVWVGNFDGRPRQGISGSQHAGPLLFDLFRAIDPEGVAPVAPGRPVAPETIEVCAVSHELPGPFCPARLRVPYLPGRSRLAACSYHRRVLVDAETGELLAGDCLAGRPHGVPAADAVLRPSCWPGGGRRGQPVEGLPRLSPALPAGCRRASRRGSSRPIRPPPTGCGGTPRPSTSASLWSPGPSPGASRLFWYQDGLLVAAMRPRESRFFDSVRGEHRLVVTDDLGARTGSRTGWIDHRWPPS